ncbi:MAG: hypothetical protein JXB35_15495 [Anaerolineae bacterium]|nr:hypothetical protein [Anaerolineae bacterium]
MWDVHSDEWWMHALEGTLTGEEQRVWELHLCECTACREEWAALAQLDLVLNAAPEPPLPVNFAQNTIAKVLHAQRRRRVWTIFGSIATLFLAAVILLVAFGPALPEISRAAAAINVSRDVLFQALMRIAVQVIAAGKMFTPVALGVAAACFFFLMPNGVLATLAIVMMRKKQAAQYIEVQS